MLFYVVNAHSNLCRFHEPKAKPSEFKPAGQMIQQYQVYQLYQLISVMAQQAQSKTIGILSLVNLVLTILLPQGLKAYSH